MLNAVALWLKHPGAGPHGYVDCALLIVLARLCVCAFVHVRSHFGSSIWLRPRVPRVPASAARLGAQSLPAVRASAILIAAMAGYHHVDSITSAANLSTKKEAPPMLADVHLGNYNSAVAELRT